MRTATRLPAESSTSGTGDVLDQLQQDHRRVEALFAQASLTAGPLRHGVILAIVEELSAHAEVEEAAVYPAMASVITGGAPVTDRAVAEHQEMKNLLARLGKAEPDDAATDDLRELQLIVQQHVAVEEAQLFPAFRQSATPEAWDQLTAATEGLRGGGGTPQKKTGSRAPARKASSKPAKKKSTRKA